MINSNIASNIMHCLRCSYSPNILSNIQHNNMLLDDRFALISNGFTWFTILAPQTTTLSFLHAMGLLICQCPKVFFVFTIIITKFGRKCLGTTNFLLGIKDHPCRLGHKNMILLFKYQGTSYMFHYFGP
jgi:hypothetical protein